MLLRRIFGPKRFQETGRWRRIHNEELYAVYSSGEQIKKFEMSRSGSTYVGEERCIKGFGGET